MSLKKKVELYDKLFSLVPKDKKERIFWLLEHLKFKSGEVEKIVKFYNKLINIKYKKIKFVLYVIPEASPRPRNSRLTGKFYVKGAKDNSDLFKEIMSYLQELEIIHSSTKFTVNSYLPISSGMNRFEKFFAELGLIPPLVTPDWDNLGKTYSDIIQKYLLLNDNIIHRGISNKYYSMKPRVEFIIEYANCYECEFTRKKIESTVFYNQADKKRLSELDSIIKLKGE